MKSVLVGLLIFAAPILAGASQPMRVSMLQVIQNSDHVFTVQVVGVDMIDENGIEITDPRAGTGPDSESLIRLICNVWEVHRTTAKKVPTELRIPLDGFMHYSLGSIKQAHEGDALPIVVVLAGDNFQPYYDGIFRYPTHELDTILTLYDQEKPLQ